MSTAREEILDRIRAAVSQPGPGRAATPAEVDAAYAALPRDYRRAHHDAAGTDIVALFAERAADYRAVVERVREADLPAAIARVLADVPQFLVPDGLPPQWLAGASVGDLAEAAATEPTGSLSGGRVVRDDPPLSARELDSVAGVITGCAAAIAETGTVILDHGPGQGRRALTLVPDFHLVVVRADQVAADLPDAIARLDPARPHTFISGPSATSDIELIRVEGVHGPRNLHILVAGLPEAADHFHSFIAAVTSTNITKPAAMSVITAMRGWRAFPAMTKGGRIPSTVQPAKAYRQPLRKVFTSGFPQRSPVSSADDYLISGAPFPLPVRSLPAPGLAVNGRPDFPPRPLSHCTGGTAAGSCSRAIKDVIFVGKAGPHWAIVRSKGLMTAL